MKNIAACLSTMIASGFLFAATVCSAGSSPVAVNPCADDIAKFCANEKPEGGNVIGCLEKHENELSEACRAHEAKMHGKRAETKELIKENIDFHQACMGDVKLFCNDITPGKGNIVDCLNAHKKDLSAPCSEMMNSIKSTKE